MARFAVDARRWLEAVIKQRRLLIRLGKSHKPAADMHTVETMLKAYSYSNDLYMARFICQYKGEIENILPGAGSSCSLKRQLEFNDIHYQAVLIIASASASVSARRKPELTSSENGKLF
jgi:hypothetical protein